MWREHQYVIWIQPQLSLFVGLSLCRTVDNVYLILALASFVIFSAFLKEWKCGSKVPPKVVKFLSSGSEELLRKTLWGIRLSFLRYEQRDSIVYICAHALTWLPPQKWRGLLLDFQPIGPRQTRWSRQRRMYRVRVNPDHGNIYVKKRWREYGALWFSLVKAELSWIPSTESVRPCIIFGWSLCPRFRCCTGGLWSRWYHKPLGILTFISSVLRRS